VVIPLKSGAAWQKDDRLESLSHAASKTRSLVMRQHVQTSGLVESRRAHNHSLRER
jgi:hypothetical protein